MGENAVYSVKYYRKGGYSLKEKRPHAALLEIREVTHDLMGLEGVRISRSQGMSLKEPREFKYIHSDYCTCGGNRI